MFLIDTCTFGVESLMLCCHISTSLLSSPLVSALSKFEVTLRKNPDGHPGNAGNQGISPGVDGAAAKNHQPFDSHRENPVELGRRNRRRERRKKIKSAPELTGADLKQW